MPDIKKAAEEISRDIAQKVTLRDALAELGWTLVDQLVPSGMLEGMLELCYWLPCLVLKDFAVDGVVDHAEAAALILIGDMDDFNGISPNG